VIDVVERRLRCCRSGPPDADPQAQSVELPLVPPITAGHPFSKNALTLGEL
jgi:hypothetical protein